MTDPIADLDQVAPALRLVQQEAETYLAALGDALVRPPVMPEEAIPRLPDSGSGSLAALTELIADAQAHATRSAVPVFAGGYLHASAVKALGMLGIGRATAKILSHDSAGRVDLDRLESALRDLGGAPALLIATAGDVNTGDFDPLVDMADLAER